MNSNSTLKVVRHLTLIASLFTCSLFAADSSPPSHSVLATRIQHEQDRIHTGVKNGALTSVEASNLEKELKRIATSEKSILAGHQGKLPAADQKLLEKELDRVSLQIHEQKQNAQINPHSK